MSTCFKWLPEETEEPLFGVCECASVCECAGVCFSWQCAWRQINLCLFSWRDGEKCSLTVVEGQVHMQQVFLCISPRETGRQNGGRFTVGGRERRKEVHSTVPPAMGHFAHWTQLAPSTSNSLLQVSVCLQIPGDSSANLLLESFSLSLLLRKQKLKNRRKR